MNKVINYSIILGTFILITSLFSACEKFLNPEQELSVTENELLKDFYEYRSLEMGLYGLQQKLVEQIVVLGELRGDLLTVTPNADVDLVEINNFNISKKNKYADPTNFFKLIASCNNFIRLLKYNHPEILDPNSPVTNYDKLYGEALTMRAWVYFMAVRIYGKVPMINESLTTIDEINSFIGSSGVYIDSIYINFALDGYYNDTIYNQPIELQKQYYDVNMIVDYFTKQLETEVKAVGVNHYLDNNDITWEITIWNTYAYNTLLGTMYLTRGDLAKAEFYFKQVVVNNTPTLRYQLDKTFATGNWKNIFTGVSNIEHIFIIIFNKGDQLQNGFQNLFEPFGPYNFELKPSAVAIKKWESQFKGMRINKNDAQPKLTKVTYPGVPGDFYRGPGVSYAYFKGNEILPSADVGSMMRFRSKGDERTVENIMEGYDTMVYKYSINKKLYDEDANFIVYRAASVHLYRAEIYTYYYFADNSGVVKPFLNNAVNMINDGTNYGTATSKPQMGVRGRVGLGSGSDGFAVSNVEYFHDPYTNEIIGYQNLGNNFLLKQNILEDKIMDERARELAFEGERFYDLMRVAKRRNDPSYLAKAVSEKYPSDKKTQIYNLLLDEKNWYINYFD